jgi:formylglycine-generating enzyme required for sulfatase activity
MRPALESPYPGLRPFHKREWPIFFGREPMIDAVLDRLAATRLVVVHGSSGCGKSSLIKAGVLPRLEQEHSRYGVPWRTAEMRPGGSPLWNLATAIARLYEKLDDDAEPPLDTTRTVRRLLNGGQDALRRIQERFGLGRDGNVCLLLDQFEELFRYAREIGREEVEALIEVLRGLEPGAEGTGQAPPRGVYAILTLRSDHLGDCGHYEGFAELVNATQYLLPRIRDEALLRAIQEPARLFGSEVAPDLAVRLIDESRAEIDGLPLVQHALMRLWRQASSTLNDASQSRSRRGCASHPILTADTYDGLEELLSEHAEEVLQELATEQPTNVKVTEYLFRAITESDAEGRGIRRPQRLSQLVGVTAGDETTLKRVIDRFSRPDCGFLVRSSDDDPIIDIGHEALIRCWSKLDDPSIDRRSGRARGWLQREREDERTWRAMLFQAEAGDLISSATLMDRETWFASLPGPAWAERYEGGWEKINTILKLSREKAEAEQQLNQAKARRVRRKWAVGIAAIFVLAVVFVWQIAVIPRDTWIMFALRLGLSNLAAPQMVTLPAGTFLMGSTEAERQWAMEQGARQEWVDWERPRHEVTVPAFAISKYEVTFDDWDVCVADGGCDPASDGGWGRGRRPVINVSWEQAKAYVEWLTATTGQPYRLLSEAEWEYAVRAGTTTAYALPAPDGSDDIAGKGLANCDGCGSEWDGRQTAPVGSFDANAFGLHDMQGNVWEWVEDCWHDNYQGAPSDGSAWLEEGGGDCSRRVLRGGSWFDEPGGLRSAGRFGDFTVNRGDLVGCRVARTLR